MTGDFVDLDISLTVGEALGRVREIGKYSLALNNCYIIENGKLVGKISIRRLVLADGNEKIRDVFSRDVITVLPDTSNIEIAQILRDNVLPSLPVIDNEEDRNIVGIITLDKIPKVIEREGTREMSRAAGVSAGADQDKGYLGTSIWRHTGTRLPWLIFLLFAAMLAGLLISHYEQSFKTMPLLVSFIPMIMAIAGAGGSQVSTVIIRAMATGEITKREYFRAFMKEFWVSVLCGVALGFVNFLYILIAHGNAQFGLVMWLGLIATVIFAKVLGLIMPIIAKWCKIDPALIASPLVTIIADIFGIFVYFSFAVLMLGL
jgi:magnesium transporter